MGRDVSWVIGKEGGEEDCTFNAGSPVYLIETFPQRQLPDAMIDV